MDYLIAVSVNDDVKIFKFKTKQKRTAFLRALKDKYSAFSYALSQWEITPVKKGKGGAKRKKPRRKKHG